MAEMGLGAAYAVAAASWRGREWLGWNAGLGEGDPADFVVLDADPRADLTTLTRPACVVLRGAWWRAASRPGPPSATPASPSTAPVAPTPCSASRSAAPRRAGRTHRRCRAGTGTPSKQGELRENSGRGRWDFGRPAAVWQTSALSPARTGPSHPDRREAPERHARVSPPGRRRSPTHEFRGDTTPVAVKIRLKRLGKVRVPQYRIVVVDSRKKRDGKVIEEIGKYHPKEDPSLHRGHLRAGAVLAGRRRAAVRGRREDPQDHRRLADVQGPAGHRGHPEGRPSPSATSSRSSTRRSRTPPASPRARPSPRSAEQEGRAEGRGPRPSRQAEAPRRRPPRPAPRPTKADGRGAEGRGDPGRRDPGEAARARGHRRQSPRTPPPTPRPTRPRPSRAADAGRRARAPGARRRRQPRRRHRPRQAAAPRLDARGPGPPRRPRQGDRPRRPDRHRVPHRHLGASRAAAARGSTSSTSTGGADRPSRSDALTRAEASGQSRIRRRRSLTTVETIEVVVGRIGKPHGLRGEVTVDVRTDEPERRFAVGAVLRAEAPRGSALRRGDAHRRRATRWHQACCWSRFDEIPTATPPRPRAGSLLHADVAPTRRPRTPRSSTTTSWSGWPAHDLDGDRARRGHRRAARRRAGPARRSDAGRRATRWCRS